jgi:uncharacterized protein (TIGR00730 family)
MSNIKSVCVYCASSSKVDPCYFQAATRLGELLAQNRMSLISGGGRHGLMKTIEDTVLQNGGNAIGIIPHFMIAQHWEHPGLTQLIEVESMHARKEMMADKSDAAIALPGGCGTLDELMEIITWKQLGLYQNPIVILDVNHYYAPLLAQLKQAIDEKFMGERHAQMWTVATTPEEAIEQIQNAPEWDKRFNKFAVI